MVIETFEVKNKKEKLPFFEKIFLLANHNINVILKILFLTLSKVEINFLELEILWRFYIPIEAILIIKWVKLVEKKEFTITAFNSKKEIYIVYMAGYANFDSYIHLFW